LGDFYFGMGDLAKATREFESLVKSHPKDTKIRKNYIQLLILGGRIEEAINLNDGILLHARAQQPGNCVALHKRTMARARDARYAALRRVLEEWIDREPLTERDGRLASASIATGHHADDRAETVLIRLLRGSGPTGLGVLTPCAPMLTRPLVRARRADVMAHIERHQIPYAVDPSNQDTRFLRTRVRHEVLPLLTELSPRIVEHLCALADAAASLGGGADRGSERDVPAFLEGVALGRAQRTSLALALASGNRRARVPISGGKVAGIDLTSRRIVVMKAR